MDNHEMLSREDVKGLITFALIGALISLPIIAAFYI